VLDIGASCTVCTPVQDGYVVESLSNKSSLSGSVVDDVTLNYIIETVGSDFVSHDTRFPFPPFPSPPSDWFPSEGGNIEEALLTGQYDPYPYLACIYIYL
jgi:hypothetical protein